MLSLLFLSQTSGYRVILGRDSLQTTSPNEEIRTVSRLISHPNFNSGTLDNDIGLVQLSSPVTFTNYIRPVCLAADGSVFNSGSSCWVTGWGHISTNSKNLFLVSKCIVRSEWLYRNAKMSLTDVHIYHEQTHKNPSWKHTLSPTGSRPFWCEAPFFTNSCLVQKWSPPVDLTPQSSHSLSIILMPWRSKVVKSNICEELLVTFYHSTTQSILTYCINVWRIMSFEYSDAAKTLLYSVQWQ